GVARVLADRRPSWVADFVDRYLGQQERFPGMGVPAWPVARRLVRLGVIPRPTVAAYTTLMPWALTRLGGISRTLADELLADPGLLDDGGWRLFPGPDPRGVGPHAGRLAPGRGGGGGHGALWR